MAELYAEQWGLSLLASVVVTWAVGLAPPLLIRFVLVRRAIGKGWALGVAALFWVANFALFTSLGSESRTHGALVLVAIVSFLILATGKKEKPSDFDQSEASEMKAAIADPGDTTKSVLNQREDTIPNGFLLVEPVDAAGEHKPKNLELSQSKEIDLSDTEEDAELRRYETAWRELETGTAHRGLWARAFVKAEGEEDKAMVQYLKDRTEFLKKEDQRQESERRAREVREQEMQKKRELERKERMERLNKGMQRQEKERQHQELLKRISLEQPEKVSMLKEGVNQPDKWNELRLTSAVQLESDENVLAVLAAGANPLLKDGFGYTARDYAKQKGRAELARQLEIAEKLWKQKGLRYKSTVT